MKTHSQAKELLQHYDFLPLRERSEVERHIETCVECAGELRALRLGAPPSTAPTLVEPASTARVPDLSPQAPVPLGSEPAEEREPRAPFRWRRLVLPIGLALLFAVSIWYGLRDMGPAPSRPVVTPDAPAIPGTPQPGPTAPERDATIIFACDDVGAVYRDYARIARAFEQENPDIKVTVKSFRDLIGNQSLSYTQYMQEVAANADAFCAWDLAPLVEAHLLYNLDAFAARDTSFESSDFYAAVLEGVREAGVLYAVPGRFQPALIRYSQRAFDEVGLAYPQPGWTWNDFATAARVLTVRDGANTQRWGYGEDRPAVFVARLAETYGDPAFAAAASSGNPLADEAVAELFRWYEDLYVHDRSAFPPRGGSGEYSGYAPGDVFQSQILRGKLAMWADQLYEGARRQGKPVPFPANGTTGGAPIYLGATWAIAGETLHPDAAWRWLAHLSRNPPPDSQQMLPARKSLVEKAAFWKDLPSDEAAVYRYVLDHLAPRPGFLRDADALALYEQLGRVARGEVSVAELRERSRPQATTVVGTATEAITITFAAPRDYIAAYRRAAEAFREAGGSARIQVVAREDLVDTGRAETTNLWSQMRQIARRVDALAGPEVAALVRSGRAESSLYDLTELAQSLDADEFYPNTLESLQWSDRQWALPERVSPYVIYYNQWMFDQMGVPYPQPSWTWEDFAQTASAVTRQGEDKIKWWGVKDGLGNQLLILASITGPLVDYGVRPARPLLDQPAIADGARRYADLLRRGFLTVPGILLSEVGGEPRELHGLEAPDDAAMWVGLADLGKLGDLQRSGIGAVQLPVSNPLGDTPVEVRSALAVSAASAHPEAAWEWLRFLLDYGATDLRGPGAPARRMILLDADNSVAPASLDVYQAALVRAQRAWPLRTEEYHAQRALRDAIARLARGEEDATAVMREAQAAADANIRR